MRPILAALFVLALSATAAAQDVVYRPTAGEFTVRVEVGDAPDGHKATRSVAVEEVDTGAPLACAAASNGEMVSLTVQVPTSELPKLVQGRAYADDTCQGESTASVNTGELQLGPPAAPTLVP